MRDPDRYSPLHRLTFEDLEEIYKCAMLRSEEILRRAGIYMKENRHERKERRMSKSASTDNKFNEGGLENMDRCRHLLPDPGPKVVGDLIAEVRRLRAAIDDLPCYVARAGEGTYECQHDALCPACALRVLVSR